MLRMLRVRCVSRNFPDEQREVVSGCTFVLTTVQSHHHTQGCVLQKIVVGAATAEIVSIGS